MILGELASGPRLAGVLTHERQVTDGHDPRVRSALDAEMLGAAQVTHRPRLALGSVRHKLTLAARGASADRMARESAKPFEFEPNLIVSPLDICRMQVLTEPGRVFLRAPSGHAEVHTL